MNWILYYLQLIQECTGYAASHGFCVLVFVLSGVLPVLASLKPLLAVQLLHKCPLPQADWVLVKVDKHNFSILTCMCRDTSGIH